METLTSGMPIEGEALLFLDFDGTTHPDGSTVNKFFSRLTHLEAWLRRHPSVNVVISSSWREAHPMSELLSFFAGDIQRRIVGATPIAARCDWASVDGELLPIRFEREAEILAWLRDHGAIGRPWAALDDQPWRFRPFCRQLILCDPKTGLTERELRLLTVALGLDKHNSPQKQG